MVLSQMLGKWLLPFHSLASVLTPSPTRTDVQTYSFPIILLKVNIDTGSHDRWRPCFNWALRGRPTKKITNGFFFFFFSLNLFAYKLSVCYSGPLVWTWWSLWLSMSSFCVSLLVLLTASNPSVSTSKANHEGIQPTHLLQLRQARLQFSQIWGKAPLG